MSQMFRSLSFSKSQRCCCILITWWRMSILVFNHKAASKILLIKLCLAAALLLLKFSFSSKEAQLRCCMFDIFRLSPYAVTQKQIYSSHTVSVCVCQVSLLTTQLTTAPPAGGELKVQSEIGSSSFLRAMCFLGLQSL